MSTGYDLPEDVDFLLVRRDDELIDAIARRERGYDLLGDLADDPALALLASFATEVDAGLDDLLAGLGEVPELAAEATVAATGIPRQPDRPESERGDLRTLRDRRPAPAATRHARRVSRAGAAAAVVAAVVSVSGVAAAVTGNPLAPVEKVAQTVANVFGHGPNQHADDRAKLEASLHQVDALIRAGRLAEAQALLDQISGQVAGLDAQSRQGLENQLAALRAKLAREVAKTAKPTPPGATKAPNPNKPTAPPTHAHPTGTSGHHASATPTPPVSPAPSKSHTAPGSTHSPKGAGSGQGAQHG